MKQKQKNRLSLSSIAARDLLSELAKNKQSAVFTGTIQGNSMLPWIKAGDLIEIVPVSSAIRYGDVVAFFDNYHSRIVAHRVIGRKKGYIITKGDNCFKADAPLNNDSLAGVVTKIIRGSTLTKFGIGNEKILIACFSSINLLQFLTKSIKLILKISKNQ